MSEFYSRVFGVCRQYLGDDTKIFLDRQITAHLSKDPEALTEEDKDTLARWVRISAGLFLAADDAVELEKSIRNL
ncbi:hypothetical protein ACFLTD_05060 [Elusimicrobiota bacterium]